MGNKRSKASPNQHTKLRLFAESAGYCQNPDCHRQLFFDGEDTHVGEMAHIFAASDDGPRAYPGLQTDERGLADNLVVLCPTCHTMIDKNPESYTAEKIKRWKTQHQRDLEKLFGVEIYSDRPSLRAAIESLLEENKRAFLESGPELNPTYDPESEIADLWRKRLAQTIIPNNKRILLIVEANAHLLIKNEKQTLQDFRLHSADLEVKHFGNQVQGRAKRFPIAMANMAKD